MNTFYRRSFTPPLQKTVVCCKLAKLEAGPVGLLAFAPSDDGEATDAPEYEDADSGLVDEDMRSTAASIENMTDDATVSVEDMDDTVSSSGKT
ncbi:hypothetical protein PC110_g18604 [Phytophthora cactorum]|uniref:Uncharacterized protein n=1 Tax=Phytophthora cactorum TaxID=29920 RepID=A0A329RMS6_9STRA|nr:hypothetical protein PC110_g18604 [Phytophthora cactorum]